MINVACYTSHKARLGIEVLDLPRYCRQSTCDMVSRYDGLLYIHVAVVKRQVSIGDTASEILEELGYKIKVLLDRD